MRLIESDMNVSFIRLCRNTCPPRTRQRLNDISLATATGYISQKSPYAPLYFISHRADKPVDYMLQKAKRFIPGRFCHNPVFEFLLCKDGFVPLPVPRSTMPIHFNFLSCMSISNLAKKASDALFFPQSRP